jgi:hypothetical protein
MTIDETICYVAVQSGLVDFVLADGRRVQIPIEWLPKLHAMGPRGCGDARIAADGQSVTWPAIGETVSVAHVLTRRRTA